MTLKEKKKRLLALVVEKTGYPKDMLDLELDLEADLGRRHGEAGGIVRGHS